MMIDVPARGATYLTGKFGHFSGQGNVRTVDQSSSTTGFLTSFITVTDLEQQEFELEDWVCDRKIR